MAVAWILLCALLGFGLASSVEVRLKGGKHEYEGRIEVSYNGTWKAVCDHGWNRKAARVVCRMLGFSDVLRYTKGHHAFGRGNGRFWLDDVKCTGNEESIEMCSHGDWGKHNCHSHNQAGAVCRVNLADVVLKPAPSKASGEVMAVQVRLQGVVENDYISEGVVQVEHEGTWGYVCPSNWIAVNSYVLCGQLGFPNTDEQESFKATIQDVEPVYWLDQVTCQGWESSIVSCDHAGFVRHQCEGGGALKIKCLRRKITKPLEVRLRSGALISEGRVEVKYHDHWGTICDDHWTLKEANVVCRSLGYGSAAVAAKNAYYGRSIGAIMLDDVHCTGAEKSITQCRHRDWHRSNCDNYEDASVKCHVPQLQGHQIRLGGGANPKEGRVEVFHDGSWGTICADGWGIEEAMTVCRQLNLGYAGEAVTESNFSQTDLRVLMSGVKCRVNEISIYKCQRNEWQNVTCSSDKNFAGVVCVDALPDIVLDKDSLKGSIRMDYIPMEALACAMEENCLAKSAYALIKFPDSGRYRRRLLRFTIKVENRGLDHFRPTAPKSTWEWHKCHRHYHSMETFTTYDIIRQNSGEKVAQGHKASFCLEDTKCDTGFEQTWNCTDGGDQGISPGCYDIYYWNIDCQWVDVTDFVHGKFYLRIRLNPGNQVAESDFRNNVAKCSLYDYGSYFLANNCWLEDCDSGLDTHGGNSGGNCCVFPFLYQDKLYHSCTMDGFNKKWCSTTYNFNNDKKWGLCYD